MELCLCGEGTKVERETDKGEAQSQMSCSGKNAVTPHPHHQQEVTNIWCLQSIKRVSLSLTRRQCIRSFLHFMDFLLRTD